MSIGTFGQEFRRLRFSIKVKIGDGWALAFQPDFAETISDNSNTGGKGVIKDALIYKKAFKGFGKIDFGNAKSAGGLYENTSSNNLIFMERPMYNETMNFGHRAGSGYDTSGALGDKFHLKVALIFHGHEGAIEQNISDGNDWILLKINESLGFSVATITRWSNNKNQNLLVADISWKKPLWLF